MCLYVYMRPRPSRFCDLRAPGDTGWEAAGSAHGSRGRCVWRDEERRRGAARTPRSVAGMRGDLQGEAARRWRVAAAPPCAAMSDGAARKEYSDYGGDAERLIAEDRMARAGATVGRSAAGGLQAPSSGLAMSAPSVLAKVDKFSCKNTTFPVALGFVRVPAAAGSIACWVLGGTGGGRGVCCDK